MHAGQGPFMKLPYREHDHKGLIIDHIAGIFMKLPYKELIAIFEQCVSQLVKA